MYCTTKGLAIKEAEAMRKIGDECDQEDIKFWNSITDTGNCRDIHYLTQLQMDDTHDTSKNKDLRWSTLSKTICEFNLKSVKTDEDQTALLSKTFLTR